MQDSAAFGGLYFEVFEFEAEELPGFLVVQNLLFALINPGCEVVFLAVALVHTLLEIVLYLLLELSESIIQSFDTVKSVLGFTFAVSCG